MSAMSDTAGASFIPIIAAQLPRLLLADAPFWVGAGDNHRQAVKVFRLWVNRKIFPETWLEQYVNKLELFIKNSFPADIDTQERKMDGMHFEESGRNIALQCFNTETTILSLTGSEHLPKRISGPLQPPWRQLHNNVSFQPVGVSQRPLVPSKGFTTIASRPPTRQGHETAHDVVWTTGNFEWLFEACLIDDGKMCMICSADYNITDPPLMLVDFPGLEKGNLDDSLGDVKFLKKYCIPEVIERCSAEHKAYASQNIAVDNKHCKQEFQCAELKKISEPIEHALKRQQRGLDPDSDNLSIIIESLSLTTDLKESIELEKERMRAVTNKSQGDIDLSN
ncbi:hypothetical protein AgCh_002527 [Apium graveolens]